MFSDLTPNHLRSSNLSLYLTCLVLHVSWYAFHRRHKAGTVQAVPVTTKNLLFYFFFRILEFLILEFSYKETWNFYLYNFLHVSSFCLDYVTYC